MIQIPVPTDRNLRVFFETKTLGPKFLEASHRFPKSTRLFRRSWEGYGKVMGMAVSFLRVFGLETTQQLETHIFFFNQGDQILRRERVVGVCSVSERSAGCSWHTRQIRFSGIARDCCRLISSCATKCLVWRMDARCLRDFRGSWRGWMVYKGFPSKFSRSHDCEPGPHGFVLAPKSNANQNETHASTSFFAIFQISVGYGYIHPCFFH